MKTQQIEPVNPTFGPSVYGAKLFIDSPNAVNLGVSPIVIDIETDEKDNFVGLALCGSSDAVYYYSKLSKLPHWINEVPLIGHNLKFDMKLLRKWGINVRSRQMFFDTCLASYVINTTKETHSLKDLAKEYLNYEWPTYKDMVGKGRKKVTLDKQEVGRVAAYCGMDALATYKLHLYFLLKMNPQQRRILTHIELPVARILMDMELMGASINVDYLHFLDKQFKTQLEVIDSELNSMWYDLGREERLNPNSNRQVAELLEHQGAV